MARATVDALKQLRRPEDVAKARGLSIDDVLPWKKPKDDEPASEPAVAAAPAAEEAPASA
jgi:hypothetical protein